MVASSHPIRVAVLDLYDEIVARVDDPHYLEPTHRTILPLFLCDAVARLRPEAAERVRRPGSDAPR